MSTIETRTFILTGCREYLKQGLKQKKILSLNFFPGTGRAGAGQGGWRAAHGKACNDCGNLNIWKNTMA